MNREQCFVEVDYHQNSKRGQVAIGDVFASHKLANEDRTICILADGLGSGIKARVLATLTATMAMKFVSSDIDVKRAAEIIMATLPICSQRQIGYSTFTIVDVQRDGLVRIIEYDNPPYGLFREGKKVEVAKTEFAIETANLGQRTLQYSQFHYQEGDRLVVFSDGVSQSGMGSGDMPMGWTAEAALSYVDQTINAKPGISARRLARDVVHRAELNDGRACKDDTSCAVIYFRQPRKLLVVTGPPINKKRDADMAEIVESFVGKKVICGGTTANIIARQLEREIDIDLSGFDPVIPPASSMPGVDLITEGTITLSRVAKLLESGQDPERLAGNAAVKLLKYLLDSDIIEFVVGTKINEAHQDPNLPVELDIRRNLVKRFVALLNEKYLKDARLRFI